MAPPHSTILPPLDAAPHHGGDGSFAPGVEERNSVIASQKREAEGGAALVRQAHARYAAGRYKEALEACERAYVDDACRADNLLLLGAIHFQLRNFSESIFYLQQCIRVDPSLAEAYSNLGNVLRELGDAPGAVQFYLRAIHLKPRFCDAYNNLAAAYMQLGRLSEAADAYQMALLLDPGLADAHSNLGNLYKAQGRPKDAKQCYLEAIRIRPDLAVAWSNVAGVLKDEGQLEAAVAHYREAIRLCPEFADAHSNLGNAIKEHGLIDDAMNCYRKAIELRPDFAIAHSNLGSCYYALGQLEAAIQCFRHALQLEPAFPDAQNNLGNALRDAKRLDEAINCYREALRLRPDHPHAWNNLGNAMKDRGLLREAAHCYVTAIRIMPKFAAAHSNLGSVLKEQGKLDQALAHYCEAMQIDSKFPDAFLNAGNVYKDLGCLADAVRCYAAAIQIRPTYAEAYANLGGVYKDGGRIEHSVTCYRKALELRPDFPDALASLIHSKAFICDWATRDADLEALDRLLSRQLADDGSASSAVPCLPSVQPFHALSYPISAARMRDLAARYARRVVFAAASLSPLPPPPLPPDSLLASSAAAIAAGEHLGAKQRRIRLGYASSDIGNHPLSHLMQSVFEMHDQDRFEVFCYALAASDGSEWRLRVEADSEHFRDVSGMTAVDAARAIREDGIDVIVNLNGYTKGARNEIFALRPAPVQVSYLGFCGTMGAEFIQYMIADRIVIPDASRHFYTENVLYMPNTYFVNDHRQSARDAIDAKALPTRAQYGLPEDKFVYCNFSQLYKIDPQVFDTWMAILRRVPNSILWLLRFPPAGEANLRAQARARGVRDHQLHFSDVAPKAEHIKRAGLADLFLDTPLCNAHTVGCDVLWSGTPVLTVSGDKMANRVAESLLRAAEDGERALPRELVARSLAEYEETAVKMATDPDVLFEARETLAAARERCPLFDTLRWVRNAEQLLAKAVLRHANALPPCDMDGEDVGPIPSDDQSDSFLRRRREREMAAAAAAAAAAAVVAGAAAAAAAPAQTTEGEPQAVAAAGLPTGVGG